MGRKRNGQHYLLLLWKNYLLSRRMLIRTFLEITLPVFFAILLLGIRRIVKSEIITEDTNYKPFSINELPNFTEIKPSTFAYAPNTTFTKKIAKRVAADLKLGVSEYATEEDLVHNIRDSTVTLGGIVFTSLPNETSNDITYKIRLSSKPKNTGQSTSLFGGDTDWKTNLLYIVFPLVGPREKNSTTGGDPGYYREGFLTLQRSIDFAIINERNLSSINEIKLELQRFPYPPYKSDNFVLIIQIWFPFLLIMSYIFSAINTVKNIVYEKEKGLKEAMKVMGLNSWIHWLAWFTRSIVFLVIADVLISLCYVIKVPLSNGGKSSVIGESSITLLFVFLFSYSITSICFMFLISSLFDKANSAAAGAGGLWFISYLPYAFIQPRYASNE